MSHLNEPTLNLRFPPRASIISGSIQQPESLKRKETEFEETSVYHYMVEVTYRCGDPYTTRVPPQVRHLPTCNHAFQNELEVKDQPKLICDGLESSPVPVEIFATCDSCLKDRFKRPGKSVGLKELVRDSEWALAYIRETGEGGQIVLGERWLRVEGEKGWRNIEKQAGEVVTVEYEGEEWIIIC